MKKKIVHRRKKNTQSLYAQINWQEAKSLFDRPIPLKNAHHHARVSSILYALAQAGDNGIMYLMHADNPWIVGVLLGQEQPPRWRTKQLIQRLEKQHAVTIREHTDGNITIKITKHGLVRALTYKLDTLQLHKIKHWDGKWRVVIFDVPEKYRLLRNEFRKRLRQLNLYPLQKSVYVSPYSCFSEIDFLRELFGVAFSVRYLVAEEIEEDAILRQYFQL